MSTSNERLLVFVGSYAEEAEKGLSVFQFNEDSVELSLLSDYAGIKNPTFLNVDAAAAKLYAITEAVNSDGKKVGAAATYAIDANDGTLTEVNRASTVESTTCHIQRDRDSRYLTVTSYHGGMIGLLAIEDDGKIGGLLDVRQHEGSSVDPERQDRPHPHSAFYSPDERFLFVQDLGLDRIFSYRVDRDGQKLEPNGETALQPGAGPRHLVFHPDATYAYAINELDSTVTAFRYDSAAGTLTTLETVSTLPEGYAGENGCAEIAISGDGRYLYGSNRGHDSIVVYEVDEASGRLTSIQHAPTGGGHPRHFALTPSGRFLLAANRDGNNIVVFRVGQENGRLETTGVEARASKPVCVVPVYLSR